MNWLGRRESSNVEDGRSGGGGGFLGGGLKLGGGAGIIILIISLLMGRNPMELLNSGQLGGAADQSTEQVQTGPIQDEQGKFVAVILASTEDVWGKVFQEQGQQYHAPKLRLFRDQTASGCGTASSAVGPFYCPADRKVYIDLAFYDQLKDQLNAPGDFANAYVIAHEVGHHVQNLLGISDQVDRQRQQMSETEYNKVSVRVELQADYFAGVWAHYAQQDKGFLQPGDIEEALNAAAAIGDDRLQQQSQGRVVPDAFTHGTSEQRVRWFKRGFESGTLEGGNTFDQEI